LQQKKKDVEQKARVIKSKREFVLDILPVVDMFKNAPLENPAETERETNMHNTFGTLISSIMTVFQKYGVKEIVTQEGDILDSKNHEVDSVVFGEEDGVIVEVLKQGYIDEQDVIIRRALVVCSKIALDDEEAEVENPEIQEDTTESEDDDTAEE